MLAFVLVTPLSLAGLLAWYMDNPHSITNAEKATVAPVPPTSAPLIVETTSPADRPRQIRDLRDQLNELRMQGAAKPTDVGQLLMLLGRLECAEGNDDVATNAFREIASLHSDTKHWQVCEANMRLSSIQQLAKFSSVDRRIWKEAFDQHGYAQSLHARGDFLEAIHEAEQANDVRRQLWGPENAESLDTLLLLATLSIEHGSTYLRSEGLAQEAIERIRNAWGELHPAYGEGLFLMATISDDRGDFSSAETLYEAALAVHRGSFGELSRPFARTLNRQGRMHNVWWKDYSAGKSFRALQIREQFLDRDHPDCAEIVEDLGEVAYSVLHFPHAETLLEQAISIRRRQQGVDHPDLSRPQCLMAACQVEQGNISQALVNVRRALSRSERCRGHQHPIVAEQRIILANILKRGFADYSAAYLLSQRTLDGLQGMGQQAHPRFSRAMFEQAECLRTEAVHRLDEEDVNPSLAAARKRTEQVIEAYRAMPQGERIGHYVEALSNLCEILYHQNHPNGSRETARMTIEEMERVVVQNGGPAHPAYALVPLAQGRYCSSRGLYEQAVPFQHEFARRVRQQVGMTYPWLYADSLQALSGVYLHQGTDLDSCRKYNGEAFSIFQNLFRQNAAGQSDSARLPLLTDSFLQLSANLSVAELQQDLPSTYDLVLSIRGVATSYQAAHRLAHDHPELQHLLNDVRKATVAQKDVALSTDATESTPSWIERLQVVSEISDVADSELAIATRPFVPGESELTWRKLQAQLPAGTAFIDYMQYINYASPPDHQGRLLRHRRMLAFILTDSGPPQCVVLGASRKIESAISNWRQAIDDYQRGETTTIDSSTHALADLVWSPIATRLKGIDKLVIAPDGPLCFVSFAALPGRISGGYAIEDYEISYVNSGRWLYDQLQMPHSPSSGGLLLCGDIAYQASRSSTDKARRPENESRVLMTPSPGEWTNLEATGLEIERVAAVYRETHDIGSSTTALTGSAATAEVLEAALGNKWRAIHFAGHGLFVDPEKARALAGRIGESLSESTYFTRKNQLLLSGIVLAPYSDSVAPSILTAKDVGSLDLRGTDLVVLSACETGLGCTAGSDGVLGLTRAFLTAGSKSVISSVWKVDDAATSLLMEEFYRNLWERGQSKRASLRNAQITVLRDLRAISNRSQDLALRGIKTGITKIVPRESANPGRSHPALWAAFVLNGNWK